MDYSPVWKLCEWNLEGSTFIGDSENYVELVSGDGHLI